MKYSFVYKWTNIKTNEYYIGVHKGHINDGYIGSGKKFISKYKKSPELWEREIIKIFEDYNEALHLENQLVNKDILENDTKCLNLKPGGQGGINYLINDSIKQKISEKTKKRWECEEYKKNLKIKLKSLWTEEYKIKRKNEGTLGFKNINYDKRTKARKNSGKKWGSHRIGYKFSDESKVIMSEKAKNRKKIICPHCDKIGSKPQMLQWHFDKCKEAKI